MKKSSGSRRPAGSRRRTRELRDQALKKVLDDLAASPLLGRIPMVESTLRKSTLSLALVNKEGLLLASALDTQHRRNWSRRSP